MIGTVWGVWHAPIIVAGYNYPSFPIVGAGAMILACISFSPLYTYVVVRAESVLAAALLHDVFNGSAGLVSACATMDDAVLTELVASPVGIAGIVAFRLASIINALTGTPLLTREVLGDESLGSSSKPSMVWTTDSTFRIIELESFVPDNVPKDVPCIFASSVLNYVATSS